jgi:hypothetical protein
VAIVADRDLSGVGVGREDVADAVDLLDVRDGFVDQLPRRCVVDALAVRRDHHEIGRSPAQLRKGSIEGVDGLLGLGAGDVELVAGVAADRDRGCAREEDDEQPRRHDAAVVLESPSAQRIEGGRHLPTIR